MKVGTLAPSVIGLANGHNWPAMLAELNDCLQVSVER